MRRGGADPARAGLVSRGMLNSGGDNESGFLETLERTNAWEPNAADDTPAGRDIVWRSRSTKAVPMLTKLITAKDASAQDKDKYMRALDYKNGPEKEAALVEMATGGL